MLFWSNWSEILLWSIKARVNKNPYKMQWWKWLHWGLQISSTHQFSLLIWSPKPGVSITVSFILTPFSSISRQTKASQWVFLYIHTHTYRKQESRKNMTNKKKYKHFSCVLLNMKNGQPWLMDLISMVLGILSSELDGTDLRLTLDLNRVFIRVDFPRPLCPVREKEDTTSFTCFFPPPQQKPKKTEYAMTSVLTYSI